MRIISGKLKGRNLSGYNIDGTRPTMDRVKESVFAMIQNYLNDAVVLDLFAGSGNLGIEALSNGSKTIYFNDISKKCVQVIKNNIKNFGIIDNSIITNMDYRDALDYYKNNNIKFNIVFLDPPYKEHIINNIVNIILNYNLLNEDGLIVCEMNNGDILSDNRVIVFKERNYGDKKIVIYKANY